MSGPWLAGQLVYALVAWGFAARCVARASRNAELCDAPLASAVRVAGAPEAAPLDALAAALEGTPAGVVLEAPRDERSVEHWLERAERAYELGETPSRALRSLATGGSTLGLLAAVGTLQAGLGANGPDAVRAVATAAFDAAVLGFVTALPCWRALALCRTLDRRARRGLEATVLALCGLAQGVEVRDVDAPARSG